MRTKSIVHSMFNIISCIRMIVTRFCRRKTALIYGYVTIPLTKNSISLNAFSTKSRPFAESQLAMISLQCPSWILYSWFLSGFCLNNTIRTYFGIRSRSYVAFSNRCNSNKNAIKMFIMIDFTILFQHLTNAPK